ncbi:hypothetical protein [Lactococcus allomyrinae]|uniref:Uncharacterized protein n=1 Tax=Lactococcus allomyrinae TaxID=2419773 RepID=A0A387BDT4_9LACT|nr:hypothetical protein [Lactococcus allomyrinae]AYG00678.1 hypothetical protein D7I46_05965 [Lactococcus allomyrinae]
MGILFALVAGAGSILNFMTINNVIIQSVLTTLSVLSMIFYGGKRTRKAYYSGYAQNYFTFGFVICFISFLGAGSILLGLLLHLY